MSKKKKKRTPPQAAAGWRARLAAESARGGPGVSPSDRAAGQSGSGAEDGAGPRGFRAPAGTRAPGAPSASERPAQDEPAPDEAGVGDTPAGAAPSAGGLRTPAREIPAPARDRSASPARRALDDTAPDRTGPDRTAPARDRERPPPGLFSSLRVPSPYPALRPTFARGLEAVAGSPVTLLVPLLMVLLLWAAMLAAGIDHVPQFLHNVLALPPLSSFFDLNVGFTIAGLTPATAVFVLAATAIRALVMAVLIGLLLEGLDRSRARSSLRGLRRGVRAFFPMLGLMVVFLSVLFFAQFLARFLGSLATLLFFGALIGGAYLLAFAPMIVVRDGLPAREAMRRSFRAARLPGSRHLVMIFLYFLLTIVSLVTPGNAFTVNPSVRVWAYVLTMTLVHLVFLAGLAWRYEVVEDVIPEPQPRQAAGRPFRGLLRR